MTISASKSSKLNLLTKNSTLWILFVATLLITFTFSILPNYLGFAFIDVITSPDQIRKILLDMTAEQKNIHVWITCTLDVAYPLSYSFLFAGVALKFFSKAGPYLAFLFLLAIPVDLFEGLIQVLALTEKTDLLNLKVFVTPLKFALFMGGSFISLIGLTRWLYKYFITGKRDKK